MNTVTAAVHMRTPRPLYVIGRVALCGVMLFLSGCARSSAAYDRQVITPTSAILEADGGASQMVTVAPPVSLTPTLSIDQRKRMIAEIWQIVHNTYLYPDYNGLDWDAARQETEQAAAKVSDDAAFYALLRAMVERLDDHHSHFLSPNDVADETHATLRDEIQARFGMVIHDIPDGALVESVVPEGPAAKAGLQPRDRILAVDDLPYRSEGALEGLLNNDSSSLTIQQAGLQRRTVTLVRDDSRSLTVAGQRFEENTGYIVIRTFWDERTGEAFRQELTAISQDSPLQGLILDLRGNPGGWREGFAAVLQHFTQGEVGRFTGRAGQTPLIVSTQAEPNMQNIPLVVITDSDTSSYAEVLTAILQRYDNAVVIGKATAGNTETIYGYELSGGARLWVAQEGFVLMDGSSLEGHGVQPNIPLENIQGSAPIEAARDYLQRIRTR